MPDATASDETALRLRRRYPQPRVPRPVWVAVTVLLAAVGLTWLVWAAVLQSTPAVTGKVTFYQVVSDQEVAFTLTVDRPDPSRAASCSVVAKDAGGSEVGALNDIAIPPRAERLVDVTTTMKTLRKASSATYRHCSLR